MAGRFFYGRPDVDGGVTASRLLNNNECAEIEVFEWLRGDGPVCGPSTAEYFLQIIRYFPCNLLGGSNSMFDTPDTITCDASTRMQTPV